MIAWPILDEFLENFRRGRGGHFRSKKFRCGFFGNFGGVKTMNFRKKGGGHANPNEFRCKFSGLPKKAQHSFPKRGRGGGSEAIWKFSENSSKMGHAIVPKGYFKWWSTWSSVSWKCGNWRKFHRRALGLCVPCNWIYAAVTTEIISLMMMLVVERRKGWWAKALWVTRPKPPQPNPI